MRFTSIVIIEINLKLMEIISMSYVTIYIFFLTL